jgi:tryptophan-rich sensory protein
MIELLPTRGIEIAVATAAVAIVAVAGGLMTDVGDWYESLTFPRLRPPNWLFGPAWTVIFVLIAASGVIAWEHAYGADRWRLIVLFAINGVLNILWSPLFFRLRRPDWAFFEIIPFWLSVLALVVELSRISNIAGWLIAPYLAWVTFAGWLNWRVVQLNKPFGRRALTPAAPGKVGGDHRVSP